MPAPQQTPRMQDLAREICRYALDTGEMPTLAEMARRMGLSRTRVAQIWWAIERWERKHHLDPTVHIKRAQAGYLLRVLKDIERAAKIAGRPWPWRNKPKPEPKPPKPPWEPRRPWAASLSEAERHAEIDRLAERERLRRRSSWEFYQPQQPHRPRFAGLVECKACSGTAVQNGDWCPVCEGEGTVENGHITAAKAGSADQTEGRAAAGQAEPRVRPGGTHQGGGQGSDADRGAGRARGG